MINPDQIKYRRELWRLFVEKEPKTWAVRPPGLGGAAEIGVAEGNFAQDILMWPVQFPVVYLVDRWRCVPTMRGDSAQPQIWHDKNRMKVIERVESFGNRARILRMESVEAAGMIEDGSLSFINVDCDHSYEGVSADIRAWWRKLKKGGVVAFHDYENLGYGVKKAVTIFAAHNNIKVHLLPEDREEDAGAFLIC